MYDIYLLEAVAVMVVTVTDALNVVSPSLSSTSSAVPLSSLAVYAVLSHWMLTPREEGHTQCHINKLVLNTPLIDVDTHGLHPQCVLWLSPDPVPLLCCHWAGSAAQ